MDLKQKIIRELMAHDILVEPAVVDYIIEKGGKSYLPKFIEKYKNIGIVSLSALGDEEEKEVEFSWVKEEHIWDFKVLVEEEGLTIRGGKADDFRNLFVDRYHRLARILRNRHELRGYVDISRMQRGEVKLIGMVDNVKFTSRGSLLFTLEDPTGRVDCYSPQQEFLLNDEVIGVIGTYNENTNRVYVREIIRPGIPLSKRNRRIKEDISAVIISDIHVGSKMFLEERWKKFLRWLRKEAKGVRYLLIAGDLVDGIGIYPNQEEELEILDIYEQYEKLAAYLEEVPEDIKIIMIPGNHDIVRNTEPQPSLPQDIRKMFKGNIEFLPNPAVFILHGYKFLMYHGASLNDLVELIPRMSYERIGEIMKHMLEMRHLSPVYGGKVSIAPLSRDFLTIDVAPDVFITGHVHAFTYENYKNVHIINASCWQAQTKYQKMMNFNPEPGKVAVLNMKEDRIRVLSF